jgi:hypothetical protein
VIEGLTTVGWQQLTVSPYPYDAEVMWGTGGPALQAYWHDVLGEGSLYLGAEGNTTFGIMVEDSDQWSARLLGPDSALPWNGSALYPGEVISYLKVGA